MTPEASKTTPKAPEATAPTPPAAPTPEASKTTPKAPEVKAPTVTTATPKRSAQTGDKKKDMKTWADANPRLAKVAALRKKGASRAEINMAMYDKGSKPYEMPRNNLVSDNFQTVTRGVTHPPFSCILILLRHISFSNA